MSLANRNGDEIVFDKNYYHHVYEQIKPKIKESFFTKTIDLAKDKLGKNIIIVCALKKLDKKEFIIPLQGKYLDDIENKDLKSFASYFNNSFFNFFRRSKKNDHISSNKKGYDKDGLEKVVFGKEKENLSYTLSSCCNPISGDPVFGFLTVNDGLKVHKKDCPNALTLQSNFAYRIISAKWVVSRFDEFTAVLKLSGIDDLGLLNEVTRLISNNMNVNINKINLETENGFFSGVISVSVKNKKILDRLTKNLSKLKGIEKVNRD